MKVLVIGGGGREHALAWKLAQSPRVAEVLVAPGNAGTAREAGCRNVAVAATDLDGLLQLAGAEQVGLVVVGPEAPLVAGVVDRFRGAGIACIGPDARAAQLEGSKSFSKAFLARHRIPTADYAVFTALQPALAYVRGRGAPIVVKADGLAAGKGVVVASTLAQAEDALRGMLGGAGEPAAGGSGEHSSDGARVVVEQFLAGEEASYIVLCDGTRYLPLATSQDHKRRDDGDLGPNTGGMGAYSPAPVVTALVEQRIRERIIEPTLAGMAAEGSPFTGFLYAGVMVDGEGNPQVLEFNVRFGDPETQPILMRLQTDLLELLEAALQGRLDQVQAQWDPRAALAVVLAAHGYPDAPRTGDPVVGLDAGLPADCKLFHAGTRLDQGRVLSAGGRVLAACALGEGVEGAARRAYAVAAQLGLDGGFYRSDIGHRAIARGD